MKSSEWCDEAKVYGGTLAWKKSYAWAIEHRLISAEYSKEFSQLLNCRQAFYSTFTRNDRSLLPLPNRHTQSKSCSYGKEKEFRKKTI